MAQKSPTPFHNFWGQVPGTASLPNVPASPTQDSALQEGDLAWDSVTNQLYVCTDPTLGVAVWTAILQETNMDFSAFGELRVSNPLALVDIIQRYEMPPELLGSVTAGAGAAVAYIAAQQATRLTVGLPNAESAVVQSHEFFRYQAGRGWRALVTCYLNDTGKAGNRRRWGWFTDGVTDPGDGWFFELDGVALSIVGRSSVSGAPVDTHYAQAAWNVDPMDGTGPSGITLDITKGNIYELQFQWLGVGTVTVRINGFIVHRVEHANTLGMPYMRTAQLPVRIENVNTAGTGSGSEITLICAAVWAESGDDPPHWQYGYGSAVVNLTTTRRAIISMRAAQTYKAVPNRELIIPEVAWASLTNVTGNGFAIFELVLNPTSITGATWAITPDAQSGVQIDLAGTTVAGGTSIVKVGLGQNTVVDLLSGGHNAGFFGRLGRKLLRRDLPGPVVLDTLSLVAAMSTGTGDVLGSFNWSEIR